VSGPHFNSYHTTEAGPESPSPPGSRNPRAKDPGVNGAVSDWPPDMRLKPPMRGEVDHRPRQGRNQQYRDGGMGRVGNWNKPNSLQAEKSGNEGNTDFVIPPAGNSQSRGDYGQGMDPNYSGDFTVKRRKLSQGDVMKSRGPRY